MTESWSRLSVCSLFLPPRQPSSSARRTLRRCSSAIDAAEPSKNLLISGTCSGVFAVAKNLRLTGAPGVRTPPSRSLRKRQADRPLRIHVRVKGLIVTSAFPTSGHSNDGTLNTGRLR